MGGLKSIRSLLTSTVATSALGSVLGGSAAAVLVIGVTEMIKVMLAVVSGQDTWVLIVVPLLGLGLSVLVLHGFGLSGETHASEPPRWAAAWLSRSAASMRATAWRTECSTPLIARPVRVSEASILSVSRSSA